MENLKKAGASVVKASGCKPGPYNCTFVGAFDMPPRTDGKEDFGPAILVRFKADSGDEPSCICAAAATQKNKTGTILRGMLGRQLNPDESIDWARFEGQRFLVVVGMNRTNNGTTIVDVARM